MASEFGPFKRMTPVVPLASLRPDWRDIRWPTSSTLLPASTTTNICRGRLYNGLECDVTLHLSPAVKLARPPSSTQQAGRSGGGIRRLRKQTLPIRAQRRPRARSGSGNRARRAECRNLVRLSQSMLGSGNCWTSPRATISRVFRHALDLGSFTRFTEPRQQWRCTIKHVRRRKSVQASRSASETPASSRELSGSALNPDADHQPASPALQAALAKIQRAASFLRYWVCLMTSSTSTPPLLRQLCSRRDLL